MDPARREQRRFRGPLPQRLHQERRAGPPRTVSMNQGKLGEVLVKMGAVAQDDVSKALADQLGLPFRSAIEAKDLDPDLVANVHIQFAKTHEMVPISRKNGTVEVATSDPLNFFALDDMAKLLAAAIEPVLAP